MTLGPFLGKGVPYATSTGVPVRPPRPSSITHPEAPATVTCTLEWQVTRVSSYVRRPFPFKEHRRISERDDLGPPFCTRGSEYRFGIPKPQESGADPLKRAEPQESGDVLCPLVCCRKACHKSKQRVEVLSAQRLCGPTGRCAYRPAVNY